MENGVIQLTKEEFLALQTQAVDAAVKALGMDKIDARYKINPQQEEQEQLKTGKKERFLQLLCYMHNKQYEPILQQALSDGVASDGGYLVPEEVASDILHFVNDYGVLRRYGSYFDMSRVKSDSLHIPRLLSDISVSWINEKGVIASSEPSFEDVNLILKKVAAISTVTEELLSDCLIVLYDFLMERYGERIAFAEDQQGFAGSGAPFTGLLHASGVNAVTLKGASISSLGYDDLVDMQSCLSTAKLRGSRWFAHPSIFGEIRKIKDSAGNPILLKPGNGPIEELMGYPVEKVDAMPAKSAVAANTPFLAFGNARNIGLAGKGEIAFKISDSAVINSESMFERAEQALRAMERVGIAVLLPGGFAVAKTSAA
ncbi:MAG: phage major capsid protein [Ignavibacteria bacterium]|nr:phage major capsid protein [Ignavibacteria bacterium]MCU7504683.1 phage major capsid protein [Ignavibacteria bacterium]MCU7516285.1 phage major capsid protein [Ignavibacteria bacterium]